MITHIVLFKLTDRSLESAKKAKDVLMSMKSKIDELKHIEVGIDITRDKRSYDLSLLTKFESIEDLKAYQMDSFHVKVSEYMVSNADSIVVVDYEL